VDEAPPLAPQDENPVPMQVPDLRALQRTAYNSSFLSSIPYQVLRITRPYQRFPSPILSLFFSHGHRRLFQSSPFQYSCSYDHPPQIILYGMVRFFPSLKAKILLVILMVPFSYLQNLTLLLFRHQMTNTWSGGLLTNVSFVFFSSLTEESFAEIVGLSTTREVWLALETAFNHRSKAPEIHLKDELQLMKRGSRPVTHFARAFKSLYDQFHAIGRPVDHTNKVRWFLCGLGAISPVSPLTRLHSLTCPYLLILFPKLKVLRFFRGPSHWTCN